jgi:hypothetical protein
LQPTTPRWNSAPHIDPDDLMNGLIERWGSYKPRLTVS